MKTSASIGMVHIHTLGPSGTNLEAAARDWLGQNGGGEVVLHSSLEEAILVIPRTGEHAIMACAVYPDLHKLVFSNLSSMKMVDSFVMPTHNMVFATSGTLTPKVVATHPAPAGLVPEEAEKRIVLSNSQAAIDCAKGAVDGCITTIVAARERNLTIVKDFGAVPMVFLIAVGEGLVDQIVGRCSKSWGTSRARAAPAEDQSVVPGRPRKPSALIRRSSPRYGPQERDLGGSVVDLTITSPKGILWKRIPGGTSTGEEFLAALDALKGFYSAERQWNWWRKGQSDAEHQRLMAIIEQWDRASPPSSGYLTAEELDARYDAQEARQQEERQARAAAYDKEQADARIRMLSEEATAAFMRIVLTAPASKRQHTKAEELCVESETKAAELRARIGDPDMVVDQHGDLPPTRRMYNLSSHTDLFRHPLLRELHSSKQRARFNRLLSMPTPRVEDMCSECQAPTEWHHYAISFCLFQGKPAPGSRGEQLARLLPGWLERCPACTPYQLQHRWGHNALPDFDGQQWQKMLTPLLRALFASTKSAASRKAPPDRQASLKRRLATAEAEVERLRRQLAETDPEQDQDSSEG